MTIISGTADHRFPIFVSILHYCCLKYAKISTSFPVIRSSYFLKYDAQIAANGVSGVYISKIFRGGMPPDTPRMSHAFGASLHDHSHDAGFATADRRTRANRAWASCAITAFSLLAAVVIPTQNDEKLTSADPSCTFNSLCFRSQSSGSVQKS